MRVGLVFDTFDSYPWDTGDPPDADAEFEPKATVDALAEALRMLGCEPVRIGTTQDLLQCISALDIDVALSIAEGTRGRNREAHPLALLELAGISYIGSDGLTLSLSLDKSWTKDLAVVAGVKTPDYCVYSTPEEVTHDSLPGPFPLFVKPRYEGSSKGITRASKVHTLEEVRSQVDRLCRMYRQDVLVESFVEGGGEFTVALRGNDPPEALPVLQRAVEASTRIGLHALDRRGYAPSDLSYDLEGVLTPELEARLQDAALRVYQKLECKDFARADFRVDAGGEVWFLEINPLPTFAPDGTFAILAELVAQPYTEFLAATLEKAFVRLGMRGDLTGPI